MRSHFYKDLRVQNWASYWAPQLQRKTWQLPNIRITNYCIMATNYSINLGKIIEEQAIQAVKWTIEELYVEIQKKSPVRTWKYLSQHRILWIRKEWNRIIWEITNEGEYPEKVEFWWRKTAVNWHMHDWSIFHNKWAQTYQRALAKVKSNFIKRLW